VIIPATGAPPGLVDGGVIAGTVGCAGRPKGEVVAPGAVGRGVVVCVVDGVMGGVLPISASGVTWFVASIGIVVGAVVTVVSLVTVVFTGASVVAPGCVSVLVVVVVTEAAVSDAGTVAGSDARSTDEYFALACGWGFGCEHETRQAAASKRETIVFIF